MENQYFYQTVQCGIVKKFKFIKKQEAREILSSLGLKNTFKQNSAISCDEIINMVLLGVDNFLDEIHLIQPAFA